MVKLQMQTSHFKLVIMSATLQGDLFGKYFCEGRKRVNPIQVGAKRFDVNEIHLDELLDDQKYNGKFSVDSCEAIRNGIWTFRDFRSRGHTDGSGPGSSDHGSDTEEEMYNGSLNTKMDAVHAQQQKGKGGRLPHATITKDFELLVKEVITHSAAGGEGILVFLPGIGEITDLHDQLLPLEQVRE